MHTKCIDTARGVGHKGGMRETVFQRESSAAMRAAINRQGRPLRTVPQRKPEPVKAPGRAEIRQPILGEVPTEFFEGEWHFPKADGPEPWAVVTYTDEPSPETGHVGWCWWAMGSMGDAPSYEAARDAAVAEIQRLMDLPIERGSKVVSHE